MKVFRSSAFTGIILGAAAFSVTLTARTQAQDTVPDAQVESNVLKALASAPDLSAQNIQTSTVYGTVTITGNVASDAMRNEAENLISRTQGVKKVVDELTIGASAPQDADNGDQGNMPPPGAQDQGAPPPPDGTYAQDDGGQPPEGPPPGDQANQGDQADQQGYGQAGPPPGYGAQQGEPQPGYGDQSGYGPAGPPPGRQPMYPNGAPPAYAAEGGQQAGIPVTIPAGAILHVRINRGLDSQRVKPGTPFTGVVMNDVPADGAIAIPRGAEVSGVVVDAKKTKDLSGRGELSLAINSLELGGQVYPLQTAVWQRVGADKADSTVNHAVGLGVLGAFVGAVAGGGRGAAIGAGLGAGAGVASSAGDPRGRVIVPPEAVLTFQLAQPTPVRTVSEQEMQRLSFQAGPAGPPQPYGPPGPPPPGYYPGAY